MGCQGSQPRSRDDLTALFDPRTVAVVGASADPAKWGHILSRRALASEVDGRRVVLVNRRGGPVLGRETYRSVADAGPVDLAVVCVPATGLVDAVRDAAAAQAQVVVAITAGLSELGAEGAAIETAAVEVARAAGIVLVGPNCLGVADTGAGLQLGHAVLPAGDVTVLSQSGNLVLDLAALLAERGLGVARFVSLGNQADLTVVDALRACTHHDGTRAVAVYAEDVVDGRGFVAAARELVLAGKPVVLLSPGRSEAAVRSAVSHTGSMTSASQVVDAACAAAGVRRVDDPVRMADLLEGLLGERRLAGRRVAVVTDGGGHGAVAADALVDVGLDVPLLGGTTRTALRSVLWESSTVSNPVDLAGAGDRDPAAYADTVTTLLAADDVDGVLLTGWFGGYSTEPGGVHELEVRAAERIASAVREQRKALVVHTVFPDSPTSLRLRAAGVPVHRDVRRAADVMSGLVSVGPPTPVEPPASAKPVGEVSYDAARALLADAGLRFPAARTVVDVAGLEAAVRETGFPVVLKALGSVHKSDAGGVVLALPDAASVRAAYDDLVARLAPPAVSVEAMADLTAGVELIVGCLRDRTFGPVVLVGVGGLFAEVLADTACALAPVTPDQARRLLLSLRGAALLSGARGRPPVDVDALAEAVSVVSCVAASHSELAEVEVNPLLALRDGCLALDARMSAGLDVAAVPLVEGEHVGVLGGEDAVVEGA